MPRKTKSNIVANAGANAQHIDEPEIEQVLEMPKLERQTNAKRKLF
jgi:hypothetical protein